MNKLFLLFLITLVIGNVKSQTHQVFYNNHADSLILCKDDAYIEFGGSCGSARVIKNNNKKLTLKTTKYSFHLDTLTKIKFSKCDTCVKNEFIIKCFDMNEPVTNTCIINAEIYDSDDFANFYFDTKNYAIFKLRKLPVDSLLTLNFCISYLPAFIKLENTSGGIYEVQLTRSIKPFNLFEKATKVKCQYLDASCIECSFKVKNWSSPGYIVNNKSKNPFINFLLKRKVTLFSRMCL